ncbi:MAG: chemotaxis protein CheW [Spirochaetales bacterium]|jgi:purine-binding chemotaxis protein CheW|nr:chemotaxis protein CheW [Spirochaetales bacterium]
MMKTDAIETEEKYQLVTFQLGNEHYGIDIMKVKEIHKVRNIRPIPNAPAYVEGIFNLRGAIIPLINLHKRFHIKRAVLGEGEELLSGFLIITLQGKQLGIFIDKISRVVSVDREKIQPPPQMLSGIGAEYIQGVFQEENGYLIILDIDRLFDPKELQNLDAMGI